MDVAILSPKEYLTYEPTIYEWTQGEGRLRLVIPAGQNTDFASIPDKGILGWIAKKAGFRHDDPRLIDGSKIHDYICYCIKFFNGMLPIGVYQYWHPVKQSWENVITPRWKKKEGDQLWRKKIIEDGFPEDKANFGYRMIRLFGGIHMKFS